MQKKYRLLLNPTEVEGGGTATATTPTPTEVEAQPGDATAAAAEPQQPEEDVLLKAIMGDLRGDQPAPEEPVVAAVEAAAEAATSTATTAAAPAAETAAAAAAPTAEAPKPRAKKTITAPVTHEPPAPPIPEADAPVVAATPDAKDPDSEFINSLSEDRKEELREMEVAEAMFPDKHAGKKKALIEFYRANPTLDEASESPDVERALEAKPKLAPAEYKKVIREIGRQEITQRVRQEIAPEIEDNKIRLRELEVRPKVLGHIAKMDKAINDMFVVDTKSPLHEVSKLYAEKGPDAIKAIAADPDFALEVGIAGQEMVRAKRMMAEYMLFQENARKFDKENPLHMELYDFVEGQGIALQEAGGLTRGGKRFLTRTQYVDISRKIGGESASKKYFTFTDGDVERLLVEDTKNRIENRIRHTLDSNKKMGFERKPKAASTPARIEPEPITPPRSVTSRSSAVVEPVAAAGQAAVINPSEILFRR